MASSSLEGASGRESAAPCPAAGHGARGHPRLAVGAWRLLLLGAIVTLVSLDAAERVPAWLARAGEGDPGVLLAVCALYALVLALPFVPSVEIGLLIMLVFGKWGALAAYAATVLGLNLAYGAARVLAPAAVAPCAVLPAALHRRLPRCARRLPRWLVPVAGLALLLNLPGNTALGGGGGIAFLYGASRGLSWPRFAATVAVATSVLPALFLLGVL